MATRGAAHDVDQWEDRLVIDDDLFAPRAAPVRVKTRKTPPMAAPMAAPVRAPIGPVVSLACRCGARDEVKGGCPSALDCWQCRGLETMRAYVPRYAPPASAGRLLTEAEREGMRLDSHR